MTGQIAPSSMEGFKLVNDDEARCHATLREGDDLLRGNKTEDSAGPVSSAGRLQRAQGVFEQLLKSQGETRPSDCDALLRSKTLKRLVKIHIYLREFAKAEEFASELRRKADSAAGPFAASLRIDAAVINAYLARHRGREKAAWDSLREGLDVAQHLSAATNLDRVNLALEVSNFLRYKGRYAEAAGRVLSILPLTQSYLDKLATALHYMGSNPCELMECLLSFAPPYTSILGEHGQTAGQLEELWRGAMGCFAGARSEGRWYYDAFSLKHSSFLESWRALQLLRDDREQANTHLQHAASQLAEATSLVTQAGFIRGILLCKLMDGQVRYIHSLLSPSRERERAALDCFREALQMACRNQSQRLTDRALFGLARAHLAFGQKQPALEFLDQLLNSKREFNCDPLRHSAQLLLDEAEGRAWSGDARDALAARIAEASQVPSPALFRLAEKNLPSSSKDALRDLHLNDLRSSLEQAYTPDSQPLKPLVDIPHHAPQDFGHAVKWTFDTLSRELSSTDIDRLLTRSAREPRHVSVAVISMWRDGELSDEQLEHHIAQLGAHVSVCSRCSANIQEARVEKTRNSAASA